MDIRDDLATARAAALERLCAPGAWLDGKARRAIAKETRVARDCGLCAQRKEALSPGTVQGRHETAGSLPHDLVDVIHRISTDPGRLNESWGRRAQTICGSAEAYVELVGVVGEVAILDTFARGMGDPEPIFSPAAEGEPSNARSADAVDDGAYVPMLPQRHAAFGGRYTPNVRRALTLVPHAADSFFSLFMPHYVDGGAFGDPSTGRDLSRQQIELLAARTASLNRCFY